MSDVSKITRPKRPAPASFCSLSPSLSPPSLAALGELGFRFMTPVQAATIPLFLTNKDVCVEACTGSGKTVAFLVPVFEILRRRETPLLKHQIGALIISPTRELAKQIFDVCSHFTEQHNLRAMLLVGGTDVTACVDEFVARGANILIGTPGRVLDLLNRYDTFNVKQLEVLILDEADTLLDMGFSKSLNQIFAMLPKQRRTGLFSATQTREVKELARAGLRNPATVSVQVEGSISQTVQATPAGLQNYYMLIEYALKPSQLVAFIQAHSTEKIIVFFMTCACVDYFVSVLPLLEPIKALGVPILGLHGKMVPKKRNGTFEHFFSVQHGVLLCTDLAARGIDVPDVDWIVQYDPPKDSNFFIHRVGRTARAGRRGEAVVMLAPQEDAYINFLKLKKVPLQAMTSFEAAPDVTQSMKDLAKSDRAILEASTEAFMSFIRAYKEHECSFIFQLESLDIAGLARSYALLRLPRLKELRTQRIMNFENDPIDTSQIPYHHKGREEARQRRLAEQRNAKEIEKTSRPEKKQEPVTNDKKRPRGKHQHIMAEWEDLQREERLFKRFKKGKMSKNEYEKALVKTTWHEGEEQQFEAADNEHLSSDSDTGSDQQNEEESDKGSEHHVVVAPGNDVDSNKVLRVSESPTLDTNRFTTEQRKRRNVRKRERRKRQKNSASQNQDLT